jgi:hypothetical protein
MKTAEFGVLNEDTTHLKDKTPLMGNTVNLRRY